MGAWGILSRVCRLRSLLHVSMHFPKTRNSMSTYNYAPGAVHLDIHHNNISTSATQIAELIHSFTSDHPTAETEKQAEDVTPVDTSFFCTNRFTSDIIEKNLRNAIESASSKADACRRIMALDTQGYILISNVGDDSKAKLINPFAAPKFTFCGDDFTKARNRRTKQ